MYIRKSIFVVLAVAGVMFGGMSSSSAASDAAWEALHNLETAEAKQLFLEEIKDNPKDASLLRGLVLASFFDIDHQTEVEAISDLTDPKLADSYLLSLYEHVAAEMSEWEEQAPLKEKIAEALQASDDPASAFVGRYIRLGIARRALERPPKKFEEQLGLADGCWIAGPFDNRSNVASFRAVPFEGEPLDTSAVAIGVNGTKVTWTWLPADYYGDFYPHRAMEDKGDITCQTRAFFDLPDSRDIVIVLGGHFSYRVFIDGARIGSDHKPRNAVIREGYRVHLARGPHEMTIVAGLGQLGASVQFSILDTAYTAIPGLQWLRYATPAYVSALESQRVHPIFDPVDLLAAEADHNPDARYWKAMTMNLNGYARETIQELEPLFERGELSHLDTWMLCKALQFEEEQLDASKVLSHLKEETETPLIEFVWTNENEQNWETKLNSISALAGRYPDRYEFEVLECFRPLLTQNFGGSILALDTLSRKYPRASIIHKILSESYMAVGDFESALKELSKYADQSKDQMQKALAEDYFLERMGKYGEAIAANRKFIELSPGTVGVLERLHNLMVQAGKAKEMAPILDAQVAAFPGDLETISLQYMLNNRLGDYDAARECLRRIHNNKPSAWRPYVNLDSLHNNIPYDSIFGTIDVMSLWDVEPTEEEMGGYPHWQILDRIQKLVFETGVVLSDAHWARYMGNEQTAQEFREMTLPINVNSDWNRLLVSRRLRKGEPPLEGEATGSTVVFRDLKPGDVVEVHYRYWSSRDGDLWQHFWDNYMVATSCYQRHWEYTILTSREDLQFRTVGNVPEVQTDSHCGYRKLTWSGEKTPAVRLDLPLLPPMENILGNLVVSTLPSWNEINNWYESISQAILKDNPQAERLADTLAAGTASEAEKLQALYDHVVLDIPYQAVAFNYDAIVPRRPDDVLASRWGDCKDKGHLLVNLLRRNGIQAWPVLASTRENGSRLPLPTPDFDHLIICCVIDGDTIFVDPSYTLSPPTYSLGYGVAGQPCMVVGWDQGDTLQQLPPYIADDSQWIQEIDLEPLPDDRFKLTYVTTNRNESAGQFRSSWRGTPESEISKNLESSCVENWGIDLGIDSSRVSEMECTDSSFSISCFGSATLPIQTIGDLRILKLPNLAWLSRSLGNDLTVDGKRENPIDICAMTGKYEVKITVTIPEDLGNPELAESTELIDSLWQFTCHREWDEATRRLTISNVLKVGCGETHFDAFSVLLKQLNDDFESPVVLRQ